MKNIFKKSETEEQLIVRWADSLILNSDSKGVVSKKSLRHDFYNADKPPTEQEKAEWASNTSRLIRDEALKKSDIPPDANYGVIIHELNRFSTAVKKFLFDNDYINKPNDHEDFLTLTDTGKEVKRYGGHKNYLSFKRRELAALKGDQNSKRLYMPIAVALCGILISSAISWLAYDLNRTKMGTSEQNLKNKIDSLTERMQLKQDSLQSQVDSISNIFLSKPLDTIGIKH